jgi:prolyl-tRNA synthetase
MRLTELFTKTRREIPAGEVARNAQLLIRAGYIYKEMAGVYAYLPLGLKVIENIKSIVRDHMNAAGAQELIMTSLQSKDLWEETDRWDDAVVDIWFKSHLKNGSEVGLAWSHEEQITTMMKDFIRSYRDLPVTLYQFQTKLRNETRAKSGIMRTREFVMKDLYSYSKSEAEHQRIYEGMTDVYGRIFEAVGLGESTFLTFASGGAFTQFSHEFQTVIEQGEDTIYLDRAKRIAVNEEVMSERVLHELGLKKDRLEKVKAAEVGNIFSFGGAKSEQLGLFFDDENGQSRPVILGSYGIGIGRLMGVVVEHFADEGGLVWPEALSPFRCHLLSLGDSPQVRSAAESLYKKLQARGISVLFDDRAERAGSKLADADLMGMPHRIVVSDKTAAKGAYEYKARTARRSSDMGEAALIKKLA